MSKLHLKGGHQTENRPAPPRKEPLRQEEEPDPTPAGSPAPSVKADGPAITEAELRAAWEKLESYHPLTEQALGEVLEAFLAGRR